MLKHHFSIIIFSHGAKSPSRHYCQHKFKTTYKCSELTDHDLKLLNALFYSTKSKTEQDKFLLKFMSLQKQQRSRKWQHVDPTKKRVGLVVKLNIS